VEEYEASIHAFRLWDGAGLMLRAMKRMVMIWMDRDPHEGEPIVLEQLDRKSAEDKVRDLVRKLDSKHSPPPHPYYKEGK